MHAAQNGLCASAALDEKAGDFVVKVVNIAATARPVQVALDGVAPAESPFTLNGAQVRLDLPPPSVPVVRVPRGR